VQHTLYTVLQDTFFSPPHHQQLFQVCVFWKHRRVCWTHFDSGFLISRTFLPHAGRSCTLYSVSCTQKMRWRAHTLVDTVPLFFTIFYFPQNWVKNEVLVCHVCVLYEFIVLANSIRLLYFHVCFPVFPPFVYNCCVMDRTYYSHKSCRSTLTALCHHSSRTLTSLFSSTCLPLLALTVQQTLMFLSSNVWANLTLL